MTIDALIEMSRNEGLWVDDEDRNYGFCQCKVSMTGDVVWIAEFDGEIWYVFQSFDTDTPMRCHLKQLNVELSPNLPLG